MDKIEESIETSSFIPLLEARDLVDTVYIFNALLRTGGNISQAAEQLGIGRSTIYDLMEKYGISYSENCLSIKITPLLEYVELRIPKLENTM
jgi:DNA-binding NtrC family response regulator